MFTGISQFHIPRASKRHKGVMLRKNAEAAHGGPALNRGWASASGQSFLKCGSQGGWAQEDHRQRVRGREKRLWNGQTTLGRRNWKSGGSESMSGISQGKSEEEGPGPRNNLSAMTPHSFPGTYSLYQTTDVAHVICGKSDIHEFCFCQIDFWRIDSFFPKYLNIQE